MHVSLKLAALTGAAVTIASLTLPAVAGADGVGGSSGHLSAVYVQTNDPTGNQIVTYVTDGGSLHQVGRTDTGGTGVAIPDAAVDKLASQGGLASAPEEGLLVAVNGGSNTISVFHAVGPFVSHPRVVSSGGATPVSVAVRGDLIYVLNSGGTGSIQGFYAHSLAPIPGKPPESRTDRRADPALPQHAGPDRLHA